MVERTYKQCRQVTNPPTLKIIAPGEETKISRYKYCEAARLLKSIGRADER